MHYQASAIPDLYVVIANHPRGFFKGFIVVGANQWFKPCEMPVNSDETQTRK
jgi:hypothetical protein